MIYTRRANERGQVNMGWLQSQHSFSFGNYYDPKHMGISVLRVINDDRVDPGKGFGAHGHRDMEIVSYVKKGALVHKDSEGNEAIIPEGDIQRMSAGTGIVHSEYNASNAKEVEFLQIWIIPSETGIKPSYEQKTIVQDGKLTPIVTPNGSETSVSIAQDVSISKLVLKKNDSIQLETNNRLGYLHIIKGKLYADGIAYSEGDAFAQQLDRPIEVIAEEDVEALWFELPGEH